MFSSLRRSSRLLRLHVAASSVRVPSTLAVLQYTIATPAAQNVRAFTISSILNKHASNVDLSEHEPILEDAEHEPKPSEDEVTRFQHLADRNIIDKKVIRNITDGMKYDEMTKVQRKTVLSTVKGEDVLAQAKTGTGKTIAFLLPVMQRLMSTPEPLQKRSIDIRTIIISPTRELAIQIYNDAIKLAHGTGIVCQSAVGGTGKNAAVSQMHRQGCHLLIATPGRLNDLLQDHRAGVVVDKVDTLVLDEGDTLLDQGFAEAIDEIIRQLPSTKSNVRAGTGRQSLIFSATMPEKVLQMVRKTLRPDYKFLKMVDKGEAAVHTRIKQHLIQCRGFENLLPAVYELVMRELAPILNGEELPNGEEPFKAIVFLPTAKFASLAAATFMNLQGSDGTAHPLYRHTRMIEIHSRLSQPQRSRAAELFRNTKSAILFASDVVARGMDFPNVTHVIQVCTPSNQEQYIHRLGRTGRANRNGVGYLMLTEGELHVPDVRSVMHGMQMIKDKELHTPSVAMEQEQQLHKSAVESFNNIAASNKQIDVALKSAAYISLMGYFNGIIKDKQGLVDSLNRWSTIQWGMTTPPAIPPKMLTQLGFRKIQGLNTNFVPREGGGMLPSRGGFGGGRGGSFRAPRAGGFDRTPREGGFDRGSRGGFDRAPREGGFDRGSRGGFDRAPREGGFDRSSRGGGRGGRGGFDRAPREGGFERAPREGGFERAPREGGFERGSRGGFGGASRGGRGGFGGRGGSYNDRRARPREDGTLRRERY
ncbi:DEAD/DEAH box helicase [Sphaerosporella brunnea]|uniref:ATP-dependent RNA helicase n=1 Tax=Sphaerosporella brunnea TaxID=1250544 RepID=A0A5J5EGG2_9PEZI|nr:DEAD/DEAH box helicase [Sphaerosporella brunnea]